MSDTEDVYLIAARAHAAKDIEIIGVPTTAALLDAAVRRRAADPRHRAAIDAARALPHPNLAETPRDRTGILLLCHCGSELMVSGKAHGSSLMHHADGSHTVMGPLIAGPILGGFDA